MKKRPSGSICADMVTFDKKIYNIINSYERHYRVYEIRRYNIACGRDFFHLRRTVVVKSTWSVFVSLNFRWRTCSSNDIRSKRRGKITISICKSSVVRTKNIILKSMLYKVNELNESIAFYEHKQKINVNLFCNIMYNR